MNWKMIIPSTIVLLFLVLLTAYYLEKVIKIDPLLVYGCSMAIGLGGIGIVLCRWG